MDACFFAQWIKFSDTCDGAARVRARASQPVYHVSHSKQSVKKWKDGLERCRVKWSNLKLSGFLSINTSCFSKNMGKLLQLWCRMCYDIDFFLSLCLYYKLLYMFKALRLTGRAPFNTGSIILTCLSTQVFRHCKPQSHWFKKIYIATILSGRCTINRLLNRSH